MVNDPFLILEVFDEKGALVSSNTRSWEMKKEAERQAAEKEKEVKESGKIKARADNSGDTGEDKPE